MKFAIAGAGAIGAYLGAMLQRSGEDVYFIARGSHLAAIHSNGLRIITEDKDFIIHPLATSNPTDIGPVDVVLLTVKAHSVPDIAPTLRPLLHKNTTVISAQNGIPWWYFKRYKGPLQGTTLESLDPHETIDKTIDPSRIIGCIVYPATIIETPGVIRHIEGDRLSFGELDGCKSARLQLISKAFAKAGFRSRINTRIREELWLKLLGNIAFNPISALTRTTLAEMTSDPAITELVRHIMTESEKVTTKLGLNLRMTIDQRLASAGKVGNHKTSMLQDLESGRPIELESLVGVVLELGGILDIPMPYTKAIYACVKLLTKASSR